MKRNAIILLAGKSNRFSPFTYEKPKGLFKVRGEVLIERQINQLIEAGITEIVLVVGFMKEKFFYLEEKYNIKFVINNDFATTGNILSIYKAKEFLGDTFICCGDHYFVENPFLQESQVSYRACTPKIAGSKEFSVKLSDSGIITKFFYHKDDAYSMIGHAYFTNSFSKNFIHLLESQLNNFGVSKQFWEEFWADNISDLTLTSKIYQPDLIQEFESVEDLVQFDNEFLNNIDSVIVKNICSILKCNSTEVKDIQVIQKGLTNVSFKFSVNNEEYVYRHPGSTSGNLVDRATEVFAQKKAIEIGIDTSVIHVDLAGWKLSKYVQDLIPCTLENDDELDKAMEFIHRMHQVEWDNTVKIFDTYEESIKLMTIASNTKGNLLEEFSEFVDKFKILDEYVKNDGYRQVALCHNDTYPPNYLLSANGDMYLIDWEYAGLNDKAHDIGCICCRYNFSDELIQKYFKSYFKRDLTVEENRHYIASVALAAFYWFSWGLYKGSVNDDDGFYFLTTYQNCKRFLDKSLNMYKE